MTEELAMPPTADYFDYPERDQTVAGLSPKRLRREGMLSTRAANVLRMMGCERLRDVEKFTRKQMLARRCCGRKTLSEIVGLMERNGL